MTKFVIGIGSQRAGSTLLHRILEQCSPIYMNPVKELHYFDTLFDVRHASVLTRFSTEQLNHNISQLLKAKDYGFINNRYKNALRTNFLLATKPVEQLEYLDLFRPSIQRHPLLGEITPEYMILPLEGINKMRDVIGGDAKIILIARNPVKRFISAFKLLMYGIPDSEPLLFEQEMLSILNNGGEWLRVQDAFNDYESALKNYQQFFNQVLLISYDELFGEVENTVEKLSAFLEVDISLPRYQKMITTKFNTLSETSNLSNSTIELLDNRYAKNQAYLDKVFGDNFCNA
jgi:hypothetical protein